jgi:hypothetical protein
VLGSRSNTLFWYDHWINGQSVADIVLDLVSFVRPKAALWKTVARSNDAWVPSSCTVHRSLVANP